MAWRIEVKRTAERQITALDRQAQARILRFLRERIAPAADPRRMGKPLRGDRAGIWRYRVGDYRLLCEIQDRFLVVLVLAVAHRRDAYRG